MTELLSAIGVRPFQQLRGWAVGACESAVAERREGLTLLVADAHGSVHVWPLEWGRMVDDEHAFDYCQGELARRVRAVDGVAHALVVPAWIDADGVVWAQAPGQDPPSEGVERVVVLSVACREERALLVGLVAPGPPRRLDHWDRTRTRAHDAAALALRG